MLYRIETTNDASDVLAAKPKLRQRIEEMLTGILETAEELRRRGQGSFSGASEQPMRVHVGEFVIWYVLDLERHTAKILLIDRAAELPEGSSDVA
jgi:mRNA-degrading endonuclease RelE of RelBE toxin-antitoxin system